MLKPAYHKRILEKNDCYQRGETIEPKGIMVHSTGVNQPDPEVFLRRWNQGGVPLCVHAFVAQDQIIQTLPWNWRGWHCGEGEKGSGNNTHIAFEICEGELDDPVYFQKTYEKALELTTYLCHQYQLNPLTPGVVICHCEGHQQGIASNHADVLHWWPRHGVGMDHFRQAVAQRLKEEHTMEESRSQREFDQQMEDYQRRQRQRPAQPWSAQARQWAEERGILVGDDQGNKGYGAAPTREELVQMLYRMEQSRQN